MKKYKCTVEKTDEYIITIDEEKLGESNLCLFEENIPGGIIDWEEYVGSIAEILSAGKSISEEYRVTPREAKHHFFNKQNEAPVSFTRKKATLTTNVDEIS